MNSKGESNSSYTLLFSCAETEDKVEVQLTCQAEFQNYPYNEEHNCLSVVNLTVPCFEQEDGKRTPVDIVAVIDRSGSMAGNNLKLVKKTLEFLLKQLTEEDRLAIVTYADDADVDFQICKLSEDNREKALRKIHQIHNGGSTNLCGGLLKGISEVLKNDIGKNEVASILLFTDGHANSGITDTCDIIAAMRDMVLNQNPDFLPGLFAQNTSLKPNKINEVSQYKRHYNYYNKGIIIISGVSKNIYMFIPR